MPQKEHYNLIISVWYNCRVENILLSRNKKVYSKKLTVKPVSQHLFKQPTAAKGERAIRSTLWEKLKKERIQPRQALIIRVTVSSATSAVNSLSNSGVSNFCMLASVQVKFVTSTADFVETISV